MAANRQFVIARDGWLWLILVLATAPLLYSYVAGWTLIISSLLLVFLFVLFRNPHRSIPSMPQGVVSPLDGEIVEAGPGQCPFLELDGYHIKVRRRRWFAPYYIRSPIEGWVRELSVNADKIEAQGGHAWRLENDEGDSVVMLMSGDHFLSGRSFRPRYGERIGQGQRSGTRRLGSVADIWLPDNARVLVKQGQRVRSGCDILAKLIHK